MIARGPPENTVALGGGSEEDSRRPMRRIQGVILDLDGTLVDSNEGRTQAWVEALGESGYPVPFGDVRVMIGMVPHELLTRLVGFGEDTDLGRKIRDRARAIFLRRYISRLAPTYRAAELIARLERDGTKLGVISIDPPEVLVPLLRVLGLETLVHRAALPPAEGLYTQRDLLKSALDKLGLPANRAALLCDAPHDVDAATKHGLTAVALLTGGFPANSLKGAAAIYPDVPNLLAAYETSPFAALAA